MPLSSGDNLGPYEILPLIGTGGMGEVYKARDTRLDRLVAIKTSKTFSERFAREARAVAALNHPNICQLYDLGTLPEGGSYLVMEFIDGSPLAAVDSPRKLLDLAVQIAEGMAVAHAAGFTHRDLKPDNILVTGPKTPHPGRVKILDFGLAKSSVAIPPSDATMTIASVTDPGTVMGTVAYMSPESGSMRRLTSPGLAGAVGYTSLARDDKSLIALVHSGALTKIVRFPTSGSGAGRELITTTSAIWHSETGLGESVYASVVDRPADLVRFAPDGTKFERLASFPQLPDPSA